MLNLSPLVLYLSNNIKKTIGWIIFPVLTLIQNIETLLKFNAASLSFNSIYAINRFLGTLNENGNFTYSQVDEK
jgi:hypothetical protein